MAANSGAQTYKTELLYSVVSGTEPQFDNKEHWTLNTSLRIWMTRAGQKIPIYVLTCYINTGDHDTRRHSQRIDLVSPNRERVVFTTTDQVEFATVQGKYESFQRAYVNSAVIIPPFDTRIRGNFGIYTIKIYLDGDLVKKYPYPILAR